VVADIQLHEPKRGGASLDASAPELRLAVEAAVAGVPPAADFIRGARARDRKRKAVFDAGGRSTRKDDQPCAGGLLRAVAIGSAAVQRQAGERVIPCR